MGSQRVRHDWATNTFTLTLLCLLMPSVYLTPPSSLSLPITTSSLYLGLFPFCSLYIHLFFLYSTYKWLYGVFVFLCWLISLNIMLSKVIHFVQMEEFYSFFLWLSNKNQLRYHLTPIRMAVIKNDKPWEMVQDSEAWHATVHRVTKSWTQLSNSTTSHQK